MDRAFDLQARLVEINQQPKLLSRRFEIIGALHPVRAVWCFDGLQFDQKHVIDQRIRARRAATELFLDAPNASS